jgi:hypothetical protein
MVHKSNSPWSEPQIIELELNYDPAYEALFMKHGNSANKADQRVLSKWISDKVDFLMKTTLFSLETAEILDIQKMKRDSGEGCDALSERDLARIAQHTRDTEERREVGAFISESRVLIRLTRSSHVVFTT